MTVPVVVRVREPLVPVTVKGCVPRGVLAGTTTVRVDEAPVAGLGLNVPPAGFVERVTAPANPLIRLIFTV
jgi:hypothetical protein